jgi:hypothetical protein
VFILLLLCQLLKLCFPLLLSLFSEAKAGFCARLAHLCYFGEKGRIFCHKPITQPAMHWTANSSSKRPEDALGFWPLRKQKPVIVIVAARNYFNIVEHSDGKGRNG